MAYEVKIIDEAALKKAHPDLFKINERLLKKRLMAAKTLGQDIPGAILVKAKEATTNVDDMDIPDHLKKKDAE